MAVTPGFVDQAKIEYLTALSAHNLKIALYLQANASLDPATTTVYTATGEISGAGYSAGGLTLSGAAVTQVGDVAYLAFTDPSWAAASITADAAIIYDASDSNAVKGIYTFAPQSTIGSAFTLVLPTPGIIKAA